MFGNKKRWRKEREKNYYDFLCLVYGRKRNEKKRYIFFTSMLT